MGAIIWLGGIFIVVIGAALLYGQVIGQLSQALR